jgi:hypothetical protein
MRTKITIIGLPNCTKTPNELLRALIGVTMESTGQDAGNIREAQLCRVGPKISGSHIVPVSAALKALKQRPNSSGYRAWRRQLESCTHLVLPADICRMAA